MEIYADPITVNCRKVLAGLKMMNIDYTLNKVDYFAGEQKSAEYLAVNPNAALPAMRDDGFTLWESNAILQYAADKFGQEASYPSQLETRADINRWLLWEAGAWFPSCYLYLVENCVKPLLGEQTDNDALDAESANFHKLGGILDSRLARNNFLCGDTATLADVVVAAPMHLYQWQKLPLAPFPNIKRWMENIETQTWWQATHVGEGFVLPEDS